MKSKTWAALLALYIVWGSTYLAIAYVVESIPPFMGASIRFLVSGLILLIWRRLAGDPLPTKRQWRDTAIVGTFLLVGGNGLLSWAERLVPSGIAALLVGASPMFLVLIESLRPGGVKPTWIGILGLLIGFGGIILLIGPAELAGDGARFNLIGLGACLAGSFLWSLGSIYARGAHLPDSALMTTGMEMLAGSVGLVIVSTLTGEWSGFQLSQVTLPSIYGLIYLILVGSLVGFVSYGWLLRNAPISLVATYAYVNPLVAILLGSLFRSEPLTVRIGIAAAVIVSSVVLINNARKSVSKK